jgi:N4-gp56 family major capsid protein
MAISDNIYTTGAASAEYIAPIVWSAESEKYIYENSVFLGLVKTDLRQLNKPGRQYNYSFQGGFSLGLLTDGVETPVSSLAYTQATVNFYSFGDAKQISIKELMESAVDVLGDVQVGFLGAISETRDSEIVAEMMNTTSTGVYPNGKTSSTIGSTDTFNPDMIAKTKIAMRQTQGRTLYAIVVHPDQEYNLVILPNFVNASQYGKDEVINTGEIGKYLGVKLYSSTHITTATENSTTVYKAIALGGNPMMNIYPFVFMPKKYFEMYFEEETKRQRAITGSCYEIFGVGILRNAGIVVMTSASSI